MEPRTSCTHSTTHPAAWAALRKGLTVRVKRCQEHPRSEVQKAGGQLCVCCEPHRLFQVDLFSSVSLFCFCFCFCQKGLMVTPLSCDHTHSTNTQFYCRNHGLLTFSWIRNIYLQGSHPIRGPAVYGLLLERGRQVSGWGRALHFFFSLKLVVNFGGLTARVAPSE